MADEGQGRKSQIGAWMAIGVGIGTALGAATENMGAGIAIGIGIGLAIGAGLDANAKKMD